MRASRRVVLGAGLAALASARGAFANDYPSRPVHWVVGAAAGSAPDVWARIVGESLTRQLGQTFVIDNLPGAAGLTSVKDVLRAEPDGYRLLFLTSANSINVSLYKSLPFDFAHDIAPVAGIARGGLLLLVNGSFPARTAAEFIEYARKNPERINFASSGNGTVSHLAGALLAEQAGVKWKHIPYRSGPPAIADLLGGQVDAMFDLIPSTMAHVRAGRLRALAISTPTRSPAAPDVPPLSETVPGYEASALFGLGVRRGTPEMVIETLNRAVNHAIAEDQMKRHFENFGSDPLALSPKDYAALIRRDIERWKVAVESSGARAD